MKVRVLVRSKETYHKLSFVFPEMESASEFMEKAMYTAESDIEFEVEPIHYIPITEETTEETTEEGDEE